MKKVLDGLVAAARYKKKSPEAEEGPRFGDLNERAVAAAIDVFLLYLLLFPLFLWIQYRLFQHVDTEKLAQVQSAMDTGSPAAITQALLASYQPQLWLLNSALQIFIIGVIVVACQVTFGVTPGKRLMGLRIVRAGTLETPAAWQYAVRYFGYLLAALPAMIGIFWISFNKERRGWHDYIARTAVLQTRPRGWFYLEFKRGVIWLKHKIF